MLTEKKIDELLTNLSRTGKEIAVLADVLQAAEQGEQCLYARILLGYSYKSKFVKDQEQEATILLSDHTDAVDARQERMDIEDKLNHAKVAHEVSRAAVGLWKALAYQGDDNE